MYVLTWAALDSANRDSDDQHTTAHEPDRTRILYEVLFVVGGYLVYSQVRGLAGGRVFDAFINAYNLIDIERELGIFKELALQRWVLHNAALVDFFNMIYFWMFFPLRDPERDLALHQATAHLSSWHATPS